MSDKITVIVELKEETDAKEMISNFPSFSMSQKKHFDGSPTEYIAFGTIAIQSLSQVLELMIKYLELKKEIKMLSVDGKKNEDVNIEKIREIMQEYKDGDLESKSPEIK
jgi:hypothetical protein